MTSAASTAPPARRLDAVKGAYFRVVLWLVVGVGLASLFRHEDPVSRNVAFWISATTFCVAIVSMRVGLVVAVLLLTLTPVMHQQLNTLLGTRLFAWTHPGVDCMLGFVAAWAIKGGAGSLRDSLRSFPAGTVLALHAWTVVSATVAISRNLWQSASELSGRGLASHAWLVRRIGLQDDFLPLQDVFYFSVALISFFAVHATVRREGEVYFRRLAWTVLLGAAINAAFAGWQALTGRGWFYGVPQLEVNAFWPDLHSFAGFAVLALFIGVGLLAARELPFARRVTAGVLTCAAGAALLLSGSRSTLLIASLLLVVVLVSAAARLRGPGRVGAASALLVVIGTLGWLFTRGYRGVSFTSLSAVLQTVNAESLNVALSHRPEIWAAALKMYSQFPIFGLGQGAFVRLSSIPAFAQSKTLEALNGSGAHNQFLQQFVELGPIGLGLVLLLLIPYFRLGTRNLRMVSFYALVGAAVGNVYAHSLLTREMLMLAAIFFATWLWEVQTIAADRFRPLSAVAVRRSAWVLAALAAVAAWEVGASYGRFPFTYGQRCFVERPLTWDGWVEGTLRHPVPAQATSVTLTLAAERKDLPRRRLQVEVALVDEEDKAFARQQLVFETGEEGAVSVTLPINHIAGRTLFVKIQASHCYVPLNVGRGHDARHLAVRVKSLHFTPAA